MNILSEKLTKSDKKEIERLIKKNFKEESKKNIKELKKDLEKMIKDELKDELKGKDLENAVFDITKRVLQSFHDMMYKRKYLINQVKI